VRSLCIASIAEGDWIPTDVISISDVVTATAREVMNRVQKLRKKAGLKLTDRIEVFLEESEGAKVMEAVKANKDLVVGTLRVVPLPKSAMSPYAVRLAEASSSIGTAEITVTLTRPCVSLNSASILAKANNDKEVASALEAYVASIDFERLKTNNGNKIELTLEKQHFVLELGMDYFLSALDRLLTVDPKGAAWVKS